MMTSGANDGCSTDESVEVTKTSTSIARGRIAPADHAAAPISTSAIPPM